MSKFKIVTLKGNIENIPAKSIIDAVNRFYKDPSTSEQTIKSVTLIEEAKKEKSTLILKFGGIKGGDYTGSPEALKLSDELNTIYDDLERKRKECEIIDVYNGNFLIWWGQVKASKEQAKEYIMNYESKV
jgi:hypothetical protein